MVYRDCPQCGQRHCVGTYTCFYCGHGERVARKGDQDRARRNIARLWEESTPVLAGDPVHRYLMARGVWCPAVQDIRTHHGLGYWENGVCLGYHPAMVAAVRNRAGHIVTLHRTYLTRDGGKAAVPAAKKSLPSTETMLGCAIRLCPAGEVLGLAEGIETALAVWRKWGIPVWSCVSAGGLRTVQLPSTVTKAIIGVDNDRAGKEASAALMTRLHVQGIAAVAKVPPRGDWADGGEQG